MKKPRIQWLIFVLAGILYLLPPSAFAGWEWRDKATLNFDDPVLDVSEFPDGNLLFILTPKEVLMYSILGKKVEERIPLDKPYDRLIHSPKNNTLVLTSESEKSVKIIQLDLVYKINISGLPFLGAEKAPVTLAVFSDYQ
ncbi:MAG: hypothetical protein JRF27_03540 [Deltaproteobacteria bacterium]|nr:hypothetical protein [Deltaproteobacteria bacterium]